MGEVSFERLLVEVIEVDGFVGDFGYDVFVGVGEEDRGVV